MLELLQTARELLTSISGIGRVFGRRRKQRSTTRFMSSLRPLLRPAFAGRLIGLQTFQIRSPVASQPRFRKNPLHSNVTNAVTSLQRRGFADSSTPSTLAPESTNAAEPFYKGPLTPTFRSLKIFSLSSMGLITCLSPVLFVIEAPGIPFSARLAMAGTAIVTSAASTALIGWVGAPYVVSMRKVPQENTSSHEAVEMSTKTLLLKDLKTTVYDPTFLGPTTRPFATWELKGRASANAADVSTAGEQIIARTVDVSGKVVGEWRVKWVLNESNPDHAVGTAVPSGKVLRYDCEFKLVSSELTTLHNPIIDLLACNRLRVISCSAF